MAVEPIHLQALSQTPPGSRAAERIVYVPSTGLSCFTLEAVNIPRRHLAQALPALLEDQLCESTDKLHLCWGRYRQGEPLPVIVVQQPLMQEWLDAIAVSGIKATALAPDFYRLPYQANSISLYWEGDYGIVRTGEHSGFSGSRDEIERMLALAFPGQAIRRYKDGFSPANLSKAINLRQGRYALPIQWQAFDRSLAWPLGLAAALLLCVSAYFHVDGNIYQQQNGQLQQAVANIHQQLFNQPPATHWLARARYQVQLARRQLAEQDLQWRLLQQVNQLMARCKTCTVNQLSLNQQSLVLTLLNTGSEALLKQLAQSRQLELAVVHRKADNISLTIRLKAVS